MSRQIVIPFLFAAAAAAACRQTPAAPPARHGADIVLRREVETISDRVPRHATLENLLTANHLAAPSVQAAVEAVRGVFDARHFREGRPFTLVRFLDGRLRRFEYQIDMDRVLRVIAGARPESTEATVVTLEKATAPIAVRGQIDADHTSLIAAVDSAGEKIQLALSLAGMFAGQIDFESDLQPGDWFEVLVEKSTRSGEFAGYGAILGARLLVDGREHQAFRWQDPQTGAASFYDENGRSLKRFFLRSPLRFEPRVTSRFSRSRLHPVFRTYRAHLGVDYAAPPGAPVVAVSSGTVVSAGWSGGGGNMVRLRHAGGFESYYLHLSAFAAGDPARRARRTGTAHRPRRLDRHRHWSSSGLPAQEEWRLRQSPGRAPPAAARRADPRRFAGGVCRGPRPRARADCRRPCCRSVSVRRRRRPGFPLNRSVRPGPGDGLQYADGFDSSLPRLASGACRGGGGLVGPLRRRHDRGSAAAGGRQSR